MSGSHTSERRFGPPWLLSARGLATGAVTWPVLTMLALLIHVARSPDPRFAAILFFLIGISLIFVVPIVWWLWQPTFRWRRSSREAWQLQLRLKDQLRKERLREAALAQAESDAAVGRASAARGDDRPDSCQGDEGQGDTVGRAGRHRGTGAAAKEPVAPGNGRRTDAVPASDEQLVVRGTEGQRVTVLSAGAGSRRRAEPTPAVSATRSAGPPVWPGHGTPDPGG